MENKSNKPRKGWVAFLLSLINPGLGHIYLGFPAQGIRFYIIFSMLGILGFGGWAYLFPSIYSLVGILLIILGCYFFIAILALRKTREVPSQITFHWYSRWFGLLGIILFLFIFISPLLSSSARYFVQAYKLPSGGMAPTLLVGDHILIQKSLYGLKNPFHDRNFITFAQPRRGDIVVFKYPKDETKDFIKRIVGLPGETVGIREKKVYINGEILDEPYKIHRESMVIDRNRSTRDHFGPMVIPEDEFFVLGDNRDRSLDSRFWGFVKKGKIKGKVKMVYFSYDADCKQGGSCSPVRLGRIGKLF